MPAALRQTSTPAEAATAPRAGRVLQRRAVDEDEAAEKLAGNHHAFRLAASPPGQGGPPDIAAHGCAGSTRTPEFYRALTYTAGHCTTSYTTGRGVQFGAPRSGILQRKCACGGNAGAGGECEECRKKKFQRKLSVGSTTDPLEQEADRVADQVLAKPMYSPLSDAPTRIQRCSEQATTQGEAVPASVVHALANPGRPLEPKLRREMEQGFGYDFSQVRVHTDTGAEGSARAVHARAYTVGNHIAFARDQFSPATTAGRRLLAHELAHTVQQSGGGSAPPVDEPHSLHESTAREAARHVAGGQRLRSSLPAAGIGLSRSPDDDNERARAVAEAEAVIGSMAETAKDEDEPFAAPSMDLSKKSRTQPTVKKNAGKPLICPGGGLPLNGVCMTDEILHALPQADFNLQQAQKLVQTRAVQAERKQKRRERTIQKFGGDKSKLPLAAYQKALDEYLSKQDYRSKREYRMARDRLEREYQRQVDLFLQNPDWKDKYDLLTLQQMVEEQSPDIAADRIQDVNEYVSRPDWTAGEQVQMDKLKNDTKNWTDEEQKLARNLLWRWFELTREGRSPTTAKDTILKMTEQKLEQWLRAADLAREADCRKNPMGFFENVGRIHGIDRCQPWFDKENDGPHLHGPSQLLDFKRSMSIRLHEDESPASLVFECVKQYRRHTNIDEQLRAMQAQALVGMGTHLTSVASQTGHLPKIPVSTSTPPKVPPSGVGRIIQTPDGPQRIRAIMPNGDLVLDPILKKPPANRALTSGSTGSAPVPATRPQLGSVAPSPGALTAPQVHPFGEQASLPPGSIFRLEPPAPGLGPFTAHAGGAGGDFTYGLMSIVPPKDVGFGGTGIKPAASSADYSSKSGRKSGDQPRHSMVDDGIPTNHLPADEAPEPGLTIIDRIPPGSYSKAAFSGDVGEAAEAAGAGAKALPKTFAQHASAATRDDLRGIFSRHGSDALRVFTDRLGLPADGLRQIEIPTTAGVRRVDRLFTRGSEIVLREVKNYPRATLTATDRIYEELMKDFDILNNYPEARVEWHLTGKVRKAFHAQLKAFEYFSSGRFKVIQGSSLRLIE